MHFLWNRRSARTLAAGIAARLFLLGPTGLLAQDTTSGAPHTRMVKKGDTLWDLAATYLSDAFRWPELYRLNSDVIQDPHWIYPGEILKLPGYVGVDVPVDTALPGASTSKAKPSQSVPPTASLIETPLETPNREVEPSLFSQPTTRVTRAVPIATMQPVGVEPTPLPVVPPPSVIAYGDFIRAPWIDRREGPPVWGRIVGSAEIPGIDPARQRSRFQMNDRVLIAPPTGSVGPEGELYLAYRNGPLLEEIGQVIIPTGVLEVVRPPRDGDAAVARVVRMFGEVEERDRLMPYDSSALAATGVPISVKNGIEGDIRWIPDEPVLPPLENYLVLTLTSGDGMKIGDRLELFKPRQKPADEGLPGVPEIHIGYAQVVRVTPFSTTAIITALEQPKVEKGTRVRVTEKMQ